MHFRLSWGEKEGIFDHRFAFTLHSTLYRGEGELKYCPGLGDRESRVHLHLLLNLM